MGQFPADLFDGRSDIDGDEAVTQLGGPVLARLVIVSNRVSLPDDDGKARAGGLEVAVKAALKRTEGIWFGWSGRVTTRQKIETTEIVRDKITFIVTDLAKEDHQEYYNGFANRVLWPILHYRVDLAEFSKRIRSLRGKESLRAFAERIGVSAPQIQSYEEGKTLPGAEVLHEPGP